MIVITGAAGMIGSCVVRVLNDLGYYNLVLVDDLQSTEKWKNLVGKRFKFIIPIQECLSWVDHNKVDAIIHLGACSDTLEKNGDYLMENNYRFSVELAKRALEKEIRFVYASSAATYGDGLLGFTDDHKELPLLKPLNLYGFSKHLFDLWVYEHQVLDKVVGLKYFNVFGPNEAHKGHMISMVAKMFPLVQKEGVLRLFKSTQIEKFGHGDQCRDFIYVKDAAQITCKFLFSKAFGIYNVGSGIATTWNEMAREVFAALDIACKIEYIDMPEVLAKQYQNFTCADVKKLSACFGKNVVEYDLKESVHEYINQYLVRDERW